MAKLLRGLLVVVMLVSSGSGAWAAAFQSGDDLLKLCSASRSADGLICLGYVVGIADALSTNTAAGWRACIPMAATQGQVRDDVWSWLRNNPALRHADAASVTARALGEIFPCAQGRP
jgi:hypothetical protein